MDNNRVNSDNWTFCHFKANDLKAFISFGASPDILDDTFLYMATVVDSEHNEVFQKEFTQVDLACDYLNNKYSDLWDFVDARAPKKEGGCSTCVAH